MFTSVVTEMLNNYTIEHVLLLESGSKQMTKLFRFEATCLSSRERMSECEEEGKITLLHAWRCWSRLGEVD